MKSSEEFVKAMETAEMQDALEKFVEGKTVTTAEDAEKLVKEFAFENGFDFSEDSIEFDVVKESVSEEELADVAGGGLRGENAIAKDNFRGENLIAPDPVHRDKNGIRFRMSFIAQDNTDDEGMRNTLVIM